jgi:hypothetical protein
MHAFSTAEWFEPAFDHMDIGNGFLNDEWARELSNVNYGTYW